MRRIGLTGGIGTGKSTATRLLQERGVAVVDTDELARRVVEPGQPALTEIVKSFGGNLVDAAGHLDRAALAEIVFHDAAARSRLEAITHPRITRLWRTQLQAWQQEGRPVAVVVIPLLYETGVDMDFDSVICLACQTQTQLQRLQERGWSPEQIEQRLAAQLSLAEKMQRADHVVWTEGEIDSTSAQLARILG